MDADEPSEDAHVERVAQLLSGAGRTLAVAESLTGGQLSTAFAAAAASSQWYRGAIVAYSSEVKHDLLEVPPGPVVSESCAAAMAQGACARLGADLALSVTGVGGPDPQDDQPPGTVWMAVHDHRHGTTVTKVHHFPGGPDEVVARTCSCAIEWLSSQVRTHTATGTDRVEEPGRQP